MPPLSRLLQATLSAGLLAATLCSPAAGAANAPADYRVLSRLALGGAGGWDYLSFDGQRQHLFVSRGDRVLVIDVARGRQVGSIDGTPGVHGIAIAPVLRRGFTSNGQSASVTVFDLDSLKTVATIAGTGEKPDAILYDPASRHVFTFNGKSRTASVIDPARNAVIDTIALPGKPEFAVSDEAGHVYVNIEDRAELVQLDTRHDKLLRAWPLAPCTSPSGLAIDRAHRRLFAVCDNRTMVVVDGGNGRVVASVPIGEGPDAVVFDPAAATAYSANGESGTITAVREEDADRFAVAATIPTQASARTLALDPQRHRLYLSAARFGAAKRADGRPAIVPDSFGVLTVGRP